MKTLTTFFKKNFFRKIFGKIGKTRDIWLKLGIVSVGLFSSTIAFADDPSIGGNDFGAVAQKLQGEATSIKTMLWTGAQVVGIVIAIMGIVSWMKAAKGHSGHSHAKGIVLVVIGACCFFLSMLMGGAATSIFGS